MQLPSFTASTEANPAAFFSMGGTSPSVPGGTSGDGVVAFAQLFAGLTPAVAVAGKNLAVPPDGLLSAAPGVSSPTSTNTLLLPVTVQIMSTAVGDPNGCLSAEISTNSIGRSATGSYSRPKSPATGLGCSTGRKTAPDDITSASAQLAVTVSMPSANLSPTVVTDSRPTTSDIHFDSTAFDRPGGLPLPSTNRQSESAVAGSLGSASNLPAARSIKTRAGSNDAASGSRRGLPSEISTRSSASIVPALPGAGEGAGGLFVGQSGNQPLIEPPTQTETTSGLKDAVRSLRPGFVGELTASYLSATTRVPLAVPSRVPAVASAPIGGDHSASAGQAPVDGEISAAVAVPVFPAPRSELVTVPGAGALGTSSFQDAGAATTSSHSETAFGGRGEKFAGLGEKIDSGKTSTGIAPDKTFLNTLEKRVTSVETSLGIDGAKAPSAMSAATFFNHPAPVVTQERGPVAASVVTPSEFLAQSAPVSAGEAASASHRAVEAVLTAADRFSSGDRHAVNLQFSVGGADLTVRVELRSDEVRTVFRTDSPELRAALTHEWQSVNTESSADRSFRLAPPVFSATDSANLAAFSGDGAPRQRNSGGGRATDEIFATVGPRSRATQTSVTAASDAALSPVFSSAGTALHLHTLA